MPGDPSACGQGRLALEAVTAWGFPRRRAQQSSALNACYAATCSPHLAAVKNRSVADARMKSAPAVPGSSSGA